MTTMKTVIGCSCANESCYLALQVTTISDTKRVAIIGNQANLKDPVVILDAKGIETLRTALQEPGEKKG